MRHNTRGISRKQNEDCSKLGRRLHEKSVAPILFAGSKLDETRRVCAFFSNSDEEYRVLLPFIKDGFECGNKAVHVVNPGQCRDHLQRLVALGIDPAAARQSGQLELRINTETYLRDGHFDQDRRLEAFGQMASGNAKGGFPLSRIVCRAVKRQFLRASFNVVAVRPVAAVDQPVFAEDVPQTVECRLLEIEVQPQATVHPPQHF